jgi:hypothetical protein
MIISTITLTSAAQAIVWLLWLAAGLFLVYRLVRIVNAPDWQRVPWSVLMEPLWSPLLAVLLVLLLQVILAKA